MKELHEIEDEVLQTQLTAVHTKERGRFESAIPFDMEVMLPNKFSSELFERGYKTFNMVHGGDPLFKSISLQLLIRAGVPYSESQLKSDLLAFERYHKDLLKESKIYQSVAVSVAETAYEDRICELERNKRMADSFDMWCMSLFLNVKIDVFYPDIDTSLSVHSYNEDGAERLELGVINAGGMNYNYGVLLVQKSNLDSNPFTSFVNDNE